MLPYIYSFELKFSFFFSVLWALARMFSLTVSEIGFRFVLFCFLYLALNLCQHCSLLFITSCMYLEYVIEQMLSYSLQFVFLTFLTGNDSKEWQKLWMMCLQLEMEILNLPSISLRSNGTLEQMYCLCVASSQ